MPGPKPDIVKDNKVLELRKKKISFRDIAKINNEDVKTSFSRYKRAVGELSTAKT